MLGGAAAPILPAPPHTVLFRALLLERNYALFVPALLLGRNYALLFPASLLGLKYTVTHSSQYVQYINIIYIYMYYIYVCAHVYTHIV